MKKNATDLNNEIEKFTSKLLLNSLYGKFGMNQVNTNIEILNPDH